eukprot:TRINITY_DN49349_c0_g1_i1.p1 TRINITY_DN49349_c0_g1~~TRINITY_DN49349_c0_g1_i1.p1  ORF type:complete len:285 (+),score=57.34 TRINITY_DN49349_c0_g1_i1:38-892(+)
MFFVALMVSFDPTRHEPLPVLDDPLPPPPTGQLAWAELIPERTTDTLRSSAAAAEEPRGDRPYRSSRPKIAFDSQESRTPDTDDENDDKEWVNDPIHLEAASRLRDCTECCPVPARWRRLGSVDEAFLEAVSPGRVPSSSSEVEDFNLTPEADLRLCAKWARESVQQASCGRFETPLQRAVKMQGGVKYYGEMRPRSNVPNGMGRMHWPDGREYFGFFVGGERRSGTMIWTDGRMYTGCWLDGQPHGAGTAFDPSGRQWCGQWQYGRPLYDGDDADSVDDVMSP